MIDRDRRALATAIKVREGFGMDRRQLLQSRLARGGSLLGGSALVARAAIGAASTAPAAPAAGQQDADEFPSGFLWGAATAAYQVEGGWQKRASASPTQRTIKDSGHGYAKRGGRQPRRLS
jgi:hypothetical protein